MDNALTDKVIEGLSCLDVCLNSNLAVCQNCPYFNTEYECTSALIKDCLSLLGKHKPMPAKNKHLSDRIIGLWFCECPSCERSAYRRDEDGMVSYCKYCGQAIDWEKKDGDAN